MAARYVEITRDALEAWLDGLVAALAAITVWTRREGTQGVYQLHLSDAVCVVVSSTQTRDDTAKGRGKASTDIRLASLVTGRTINRKAAGQKRFHRTTNWQRNWQRAVQRFIDAYEAARPFYERIAVEEPDQREQPQREQGRRIRVTYRAVDGYTKSATLRTLNGARGWAQRYLGETPELGQTYAVSGDGVGQITVKGASLFELFPKCDYRRELAAEAMAAEGLDDDTSELEQSWDEEARREQSEAHPEPQRALRRITVTWQSAKGRESCSFADVASARDYALRLLDGAVPHVEAIDAARALVRGPSGDAAATLTVEGCTVLELLSPVRRQLSPEDAATEQAISDAEGAQALADWEAMTAKPGSADHLLAEANRLRQRGLELLHARKAQAQVRRDLEAKAATEAHSSPVEATEPAGASTPTDEPRSRQAAAERSSRPRLQHVSAWGVSALVDGETQYVAVLSQFRAAQESLKRATMTGLPGAKSSRITDAATLDMARLQAADYAAKRRNVAPTSTPARVGFAVTALVEGQRRAVRVVDEYEQAAEVAKQAAGGGHWPGVRVARVAGAELEAAEAEADAILGGAQ